MVDQNDEEILGERLTRGKFECPWCRQTTTPTSLGSATEGGSEFGRGKERRRKYDLIRATCAGCSKDTLFVRHWHRKIGRPFMGHPGDVEDIVDNFYQTYPIGRAPRKFPNTDQKLLLDYAAACKTLEVSAEASACMSRRCFSILLTDRGYTQNDLGPQVDALFKETDPDKRLPKSILKVVDALREFGNFGAHGRTEVKTLEIIPVELKEAEWSISTLERLFDFYFEEPAKTDQQIKSANLKLKAAGKKPLKM